jgi:FkbM family methyltransferase
MNEPTASRDMTVSSKSLALLYWKQLALELGTLPHKTRKDADATAKATARAEALVQLFHGIVDRIEATLLFEIGAHMAETSRHFIFAKPGHRKAIAFEANPKVCDRFRAEHPDSPVIYRAQAIGATTGHVTFYAPDVEHLEIWGSIRKRRKFDKVTEISVEMVPLNRAWQDAGTGVAPHSAALWVDVEGAALEVLQSGADTLPRHVGVIFTEVNDVAAYEGAATSFALFEYLIETGFVPLARDNEWFDARNAIFVHESRIADIQELYASWHVRQARRIFA